MVVTIFDFFKKLVPKIGDDKEQTDKETIKSSQDECALCKQPGTDKKWMGQSWHSKCLRNAKKMAKKMV